MVEHSDGTKFSAVPYQGWMQGLWYRADWFKEAGLEPPTTWEAIKKAANSLGTENFEGLSGAEFDPYLARKTRMVPTLTHSSSVAYGTVNGYSIMKNDNQDEIEATKAFIRYMNEKDQIIAYAHMAPGGHLPVLRDIAKLDEFLEDPKGVFKAYGQEAIQEIIAGFDNIGTFAIVDGKLFPESSEIFSKQIIPRMIYSAIIEDQDTQQALDQAEKEMLELISR